MSLATPPSTPTPPSNSFDALPLSAAARDNLRRLGYLEMTAIQAASLPAALQGRDLIAQAKTGSGKTAAFALALLAKLDATLRQSVADYDFNTYVRALTDFCNEDLSAFFFDIRKDCLYCDAPDSVKRRAYRTVLDMLFQALIRWAAPVIVFTAEEVWQTRYPNPDASVHLLEWPIVDANWADADLIARWGNLRALRTHVTEAIEPLRRDKVIGSSLAAQVVVPASAPEADLAELFITGTVTRGQGDGVQITPTTDHKCGRCWRHLPEVAEDGALCGRCEDVVNG